MTLPSDAFEDDLVSGRAWQEFCDNLRRAGEQILRPDVPARPLDRASGYRHLLALLHIGVDQAFARSDPWSPSLGQIARTDLYKWGLDCPDAAYRGTSVRGDLSYRVWGNLGSVRYLSFQVNEGMRNHGNIRGDQIAAAPDGSFELWLGPEPRPGNCLITPPAVNSLIVRQFFYDWDTEEAATLQVERVSGGEPPPGHDPGAVTPLAVVEQLQAVSRWVNGNSQAWIDVEVEGQATSRNRFQPATSKPEMGGAQENLNAWGHFDLDPDEALIIEVMPANAHYWSVHLGNFWWESLDYADHLTSINGHQAVVDADGVFRAVIAHRDPGVANWLDTTGYLTGPMLFRWVVSDSAPDPTCTLVPHDRIWDHLPASTLTVSPDERAATIARRRAHVLRRFSR